MGSQRIQLWASDWAGILGLTAFGSSVFLLFAMFMPDWFARTSWLSAKKDEFTQLVDSPASYVALLSLCGFAAFIALALGVWRRWVVAAALAGGAFAVAAYVAGSSWWGITHGMALLDGRPVQGMVSPKWTVHWPAALPLFLLAAITGTISALVLAISWHGQPAD